MKTLICITPHQFDYADTVPPVAGAGETLLKIKRIGICGTDLNEYFYPGGRTQPLPPP